MILQAWLYQFARSRSSNVGTLHSNWCGCSLQWLIAGVANIDLNGGAEAAPDPGKRVRNLKKKLTQIQQLKEKLKAGSALEPEQQAKIDSEASILEEIQSLEGTWASVWRSILAFVMLCLNYYGDPIQWIEMFFCPGKAHTSLSSYMKIIAI